MVTVRSVGREWAVAPCCGACEASDPSSDGKECLAKWAWRLVCGGL